MISSALAPSDAGPEPYVGLRSYTGDDRERFFGRVRDAYEISVLWQANRLTVLYGPSGVGKTSVLQAGVLPLLDPARVEALPVGRLSHGSAFPLAALPERNPFTFALLSSWAPEVAPTRLSGLTVGEFLRRRGGRVDRYGDPMPRLVAIDQAEELFFDFPSRQGHREPFIRELVNALDEDPELRLLISIREDFLAGILPHERDLGRDAAAMVGLTSFDQETALEAIRGPLAGTGRSFATGAAEKLVEDLRTITLRGAGETSTVVVDAVEPVQLQVVCSTLWKSLPEDMAVITREYVERHADVDRSLAGFYDQAITEVAADHDVPAGDLRAWVRATFVTELGTRGTAYQGQTRTAGMSNDVVRALVDRHVLKTEMRSGSRWCELQHDRLIPPVTRTEGPAGAGPAPAEAAPLTATAYLRGAEQALADGRFALAERLADKAKRACGDDEPRVRAEIESFLGNIAHELGQWDTAERHYRLAARLYEMLRDPAAVGRLLAAVGRLLLHQGHGAEAIGELRAAVQRVPGDLTVQTELARAVWAEGSPGAALSILSGVLAVDGSDPGAVMARGQILADLGDATGALRDLDQVRRHADPAALAARALALAALGRPEEAAAEAGAVLAGAGEHGPALHFAARALWLLDDRAAAEAAVRRAGAATRPPLTPYQREILALLR
ncbi:nSTAND1 domain-containing NTPase [Sphaerisporangium corydalis]|uniref:Novel STAND NTPase 1 domain-containing protein n=1 Tax=Sphaerisporangium corydalis TaxID=1441875 RepID=A0ABV9EPY4_9ACTN|nr:hypothetical protein [Sphaerisporangium corydalis]